MTYHSFHSRKVKSYVIEPYQIYYAQGGLYVFAVVPAYGEARQFAIERIKTLRTTDERFVPDATRGSGAPGRLARRQPGRQARDW